jgi:solute carrier family 35 protein F1/2
MGTVDFREFVGTTAGRVMCGQILALLMSGTGVFTTLLVNNGASFPLLQSVVAYAAIVLVFAPLYLPFYLGKGWRELLKLLSLSEDDVLPRSSAAAHLSRRRRTSSPSSPETASLGSSSLAFCNFTIGERPWRYLIIAVADLEANYLVVKAYQYTNMTSVQLLDCFTIPCVMLLSLFLLKVAYSRWQLTGAGVAVSGMILLIVLDADGLTRTSDAPNAVAGDLLCLASSVCYAVSNVACEKLIKVSAVSPIEADVGAASQIITTTSDAVAPEPQTSGYGDVALDLPCVPSWLPVLEYLAVMPSMALCLGVVQFFIFEFADFRSFVAASQWDVFDTAYLLSFALCMVLVYAGMPFIFFIASATFANLSLLSSDIYSIFFNVTVFSTNPKPTFFLPYLVIVAGISCYDTDGFRKLRERYHIFGYKAMQ